MAGLLISEDAPIAESTNEICSGVLLSLNSLKENMRNELICAAPDPRSALETAVRKYPRLKDDAQALVGRLRREFATQTWSYWMVGDRHYPWSGSNQCQPPLLLTRGQIKWPAERGRIAVVGTRSASPPGLKDAYDFGGYLAEQKLTVISGMAKGIDRAVFDGCLDRGGQVIGVLGTGLDRQYPACNRDLYDRVTHNGLLVTEFGFGSKPSPWHFPKRNRIIASLSELVVVMEATRKGGARITAEQAAEQGRGVLARPGSVRNPAAEGCNQLIADGAQPLLDYSDVLIALELNRLETVTQAEPLTELSPDAGILLTSFSGEPLSLDHLLSRADMPAAQALSALAELLRVDRVRKDRGLLWPC